MERASNYLSASRQIENLLCTARESLLGSGAWNKEFYSELQARPFYQSISTAMCIGSSGGGGSGRKGIILILLIFLTNSCGGSSVYLNRAH